MGDGLKRAASAARASRAKTTEALALSVRCDYCGAQPGKWCQDFRGGSSVRLHAKRIKAAPATLRQYGVRYGAGGPVFAFGSREEAERYLYEEGRSERGAVLVAQDYVPHGGEATGWQPVECGED